MTVNLPGDQRYDTRGLPEGYDPHNLYEYRFERLLKDATGPEAFLYHYIPYAYVRSFAFAIDPTAEFKVAPGVITPVNRTKWQESSVLTQKRQWKATWYRRSSATPVNWGGISACNGPYMVDSQNVTDIYSGSLHDQEMLAQQLQDTTTRTRLMGSTQGELRLWKAYINSPPKVARRSTETYNNFTNVDPGPICRDKGGTATSHTVGIEHVTEEHGPSGAYLPWSTYHELRTSEIAYNLSLAQTHAVSMLKGYSSFNRDYTLFRNLAELRDMPSSILSLKEALKDLRALYVSLSKAPALRKILFDLNAVAKDIPNEYLSYHFGWKQTYKDLMDLLAAPQKIAKRYNFLIHRAGRPTTFRSKRNFVSSVPGVSGFVHDILSIEGNWQLASRLERTTEVRLIVNSTFDFPPIDIPYFRFNDYLKRIGIEPRVTDVYNLIPWTWLVDYFTGFGNYVELIDNLNHDPSLINWGMFVVRTEGKLITDFQSQTLNQLSVTNQGVTVNSNTTVTNHHQSQLVYSCETRQDAATVLDVKTTANPSSLTSYQQSIIGALLAQRTDFSRQHTFRVRS